MLCVVDDIEGSASWDCHLLTRWGDIVDQALMVVKRDQMDEDEVVWPRQERRA